jgi:hypothetical protein
MDMMISIQQISARSDSKEMPGRACRLIDLPG